MTIEADDYEQWRALPITETVTRALKLLAERNKEKWISVSWEGGQTDPIVLADLKARYETAMDLAELTLDELNEALGE